jgi:peptidoglycan/xylan/chitin deacetylase (PgdA/CDA1 family)
MQPGTPQTRQMTFALIRSAHKRFRMKELPDRVAVYFHALEQKDWEQFRACITYFSGRGYRIVSLAEYVDPCAQGPMLFISFDDNYKNWHEALGLLDSLNVKATFYVNSLPFMDTCSKAARLQYFERISYKTNPISMTRAELQDVARAGHEIGCHTHSHFDLARLDRKYWDSEIQGSRQKLEDLIGRPIVHFAYPYGMRRYFTETLRDYCRSIGLQTIASGVPGYQHSPRIDAFNLHRTRWNFSRSLEHNIEDIRIDGRLFEQLTGWSAVG